MVVILPCKVFNVSIWSSPVFYFLLEAYEYKDPCPCHQGPQERRARDQVSVVYNCESMHWHTCVHCAGHLRSER